MCLNGFHNSLHVVGDPELEEMYAWTAVRLHLALTQIWPGTSKRIELNLTSHIFEMVRV